MPQQMRASEAPGQIGFKAQSSDRIPLSGVGLFGKRSVKGRRGQAVTIQRGMILRIEPLALQAHHGSILFFSEPRR
jgi:hypothetical protein